MPEHFKMFNILTKSVKKALMSKQPQTFGKQVEPAGHVTESSATSHEPIAFEKLLVEQIFAYSCPHHPGLQLKKQHGPVNDLQHNN